MIETALARASLYNFLAAAFGDLPTPALITALTAILPETVSASLDELQRAYTRLLIGPGTGYVPPYASVYLDPPLNGKPQLWGRETTRVEALYGEAGLEVVQGQSRVPDHLALELQFMQHLCAREANAERRGEAEEAARWREIQCAFLRDHLSPWLPRFVERLSQVKAHPIYRALADFAIAFVQSEIASSQPHPSPPWLGMGEA